MNRTTNKISKVNAIPVTMGIGRSLEIELVVAALQNQEGYISQPDRMTPGSSVGGSLAGRRELSSTTSEKLTVATR
jgi:hypothetical protein